MKELICIVCPKGCHLKVDEENGYAVTGNSCPRGAEYGKKELVNPTRVITSTVRVEGGTLRRVSVKTSSDIPKKDIMTISAAMERDISVLQSRMKITVLYYGYNAACNRVRKKKGTKHYEWDYWNWHWIFP